MQIIRGWRVKVQQQEKHHAVAAVSQPANIWDIFWMLLTLLISWVFHFTAPCWAPCPFPPHCPPNNELSLMEVDFLFPLLLMSHLFMKRRDRFQDVSFSRWQTLSYKTTNSGDSFMVITDLHSLTFTSLSSLLRLLFATTFQVNSPQTTSGLFVNVSHKRVGRGSRGPGLWFLCEWRPLCHCRASKTTKRLQRNTRTVCMLNSQDCSETRGAVQLPGALFLEVEPSQKAPVSWGIPLELFLFVLWVFRFPFKKPADGMKCLGKRVNHKEGLYGFKFCRSAALLPFFSDSNTPPIFPNISFSVEACVNVLLYRKEVDRYLNPICRIRP